MLDPKYIRNNTSKVKEGLLNKNSKIDLDDWLKLDQQRKSMLTEIEQHKKQRNEASKQIFTLKKENKDASPAISETRKLGDHIKEKEESFQKIYVQWLEILLSIPNLAHSSTPVGKNDKDNKIIKTVGDKTNFNFPIKDHLELGEKLNLFDFKRGNKISGRGFPVFTGLGAKLERSLLSFFLDTHVKNGFTEITPPIVVNRESMIGTGQIPKMEEDMYHVEDEDHFLIPTAEVPITNLHRDEILTKKDLPISYAGYSPCFRKEAGSWGKDTRGFQRLHQFNKVEMVKFTEPKKSYQVLDELVSHAENLLQQLGLTYRVLELCSGDLSFAATKCYDLEVYSPATESWLEVSSISNFEDYQARRSQIRYKEGNETHFVHTLNGSGLATPRVLVALLENNQTKEGKILIPEVLRPYTGINKIS